GVGGLGDDIKSRRKPCRPGVHLDRRRVADQKRPCYRGDASIKRGLERDLRADARRVSSCNGDARQRHDCLASFDGRAAYNGCKEYQKPEETSEETSP